MDVTAVGTVKNKGIVPTRSGLRIFQAVLQDDTGILTCAWPGQPWLDRTLQAGDRILVTGPVKFFHGRQIQPREHAVLERAPAPEPDPATLDTHTTIPSTPTTIPTPDPTPARHHLRHLSRIRTRPPVGAPACRFAQPGTACCATSATRITSRPPTRRALALPDLPAALQTLHRPPSLDRVDAAGRRLAYDELFFLQLLQARVRYHTTRARPGIAFERTNELIRALHGQPPLHPDRGPGAGVARDLRRHGLAPPHEPDVAGRCRFREDAGGAFRHAARRRGGLPGRAYGAHRAPRRTARGAHPRSFLAGLPCGVGNPDRVGHGEAARGSARTGGRGRGPGGDRHACAHPGGRRVRCARPVGGRRAAPASAVRQRLALAERDPAPDVLVMSATPIPRSLAMAMHGDLDISMIDELPAGRRPVVTRLVETGKREAVFREVGSPARPG